MNFLRDKIKNIANILMRFKYNWGRKYYIEKDVSLLHSYLDEFVSISEGCNVTWSRIGCYTYLGADSYLPYCKIGKYCSIGPNVRLAAGLHPTNYVSTHPIFYNNNYRFRGNIKKTNIKFDELPKLNNDSKLMCEIGNDVWIASNVLLVCGKKPLRIGNGAIIGAGAVVVKDVPDYSIVMGFPAKVIKYRFDEEMVDTINNLQWWNKDDEWINTYVDYFDKPYEFIDKVTKHPL